LDDGVEKIFVNADGVLDDIEPDMANFIRYIKSGVPADDFTRELQEHVSIARMNKEWRREYMEWMQTRAIEREEGREEGELNRGFQVYHRLRDRGDSFEDAMMISGLSLEDASIQEAHRKGMNLNPDSTRV
jgi:hypothetical protein